MDLFSCLIEELYLQGYTLIKKFISKFFINLISNHIEEIDVYDFNKVFYLSLKNSTNDFELDNLLMKNKDDEDEDNLNKFKFNQIVLKIIMTMVYNAKYYENNIDIDISLLDKFINLFEKNEENKAENKEDFNDEKNEEMKKNSKDILDLFSQLGMKKGLDYLLNFFDIGMDMDEFTFKNDVKDFVGSIINQKNLSGEVNRHNNNDDNYNENYSYSNAFLKRIKMFKLEKIQEFDKPNSDNNNNHHNFFMKIYQTQIGELIDKYFTHKKPEYNKENYDENLDGNDNINYNTGYYKNNNNNNNPKLINNQKYNNNNINNFNNFKNASFGKSDFNNNNNNYSFNQMNYNQGFNNNNNNIRNNSGYNNNNNNNPNNNNNNYFNPKNSRNQFNNINNNNNNFNQYNQYNNNNNNYNNYNNNQIIKTEKELNEEREEKECEEKKQEFLKNYKVKFLTFERAVGNNDNFDDFHDFFNLINNIYKSHNEIDKKLEEIKIKEENEKKKKVEEEENNKNNNNNEENFDYKKFNYNNYNNNLSNQYLNLIQNSEEKIEENNILKNLHENEFNFIIYLLPNKNDEKKNENKKLYNNICDHLGRYDYLYEYFINSIWINYNRIHLEIKLPSALINVINKNIFDSGDENRLKKSLMKYCLKQYLTNAENIFNLFTYEIKIFKGDNDSETFLFTQNFEMIYQDNEENVDKIMFIDNINKLYFDIK
jgi:hypothetical protein